MKKIKLIIALLFVAGMLTLSVSTSRAADFTINVPYDVRQVHQSASSVFIACAIRNDNDQVISRAGRFFIEPDPITGSVSGIAAVNLNLIGIESPASYSCKLYVECDGQTKVAGGPPFNYDDDCHHRRGQTSIPGEAVSSGVIE
ncbi:MAG: hypothetical protein ISR97_00405 [Nitrospira sp.]|nr:hypothetical protein [Nitrospira sp.]